MLKSLALVIAVGAIAACSHDRVTETQIEPDCILVAIGMTPPTATLRVGDTLRFAARTTASSKCQSNEAAALNTSATWRSSDTLVVRVGVSDGLARAVGIGGPITVTASSNQDPAIKSAAVVQVVP